MKTDFIEIFQTIRAELQPYTALGFTNRINSDNEFDIWSEKNIKEQGITERLFASVKIESDHVCFRYSNKEGDAELQEKVIQLDDKFMLKIDAELAETYKIFKENMWV